MRCLKIFILSTSNEITTFLIFYRISIISLLHTIPVISIQINEILIGPIIHNGHFSSSPNKILIICFKLKIIRVIWSNQFVIIYKVPAKLLICFLPIIKLLKWVRDEVCKYFAEIAPNDNHETIIRNHLPVEFIPCFI